MIAIAPLLAVSQGALAQEKSISGKVTDAATGQGLPGVTVIAKGTTVGVSTNPDGVYTLKVPTTASVLVFSSIGYLSVEREIGAAAELNVALHTDTKQLSEVVVTALGIERDKRSLGYATQELKGEVLSQKSEPNLLNALQGRLAGVNIVTASGLPGASSNINIRGVSSLQGNNQPLFVVDGIPISNDLDRTSSSLFGAQQANRALDIDPESIESMTILKGPAAAALYGSRAASGAIIITTKSGRNLNKKLEVTVASGFSQQRVYGLIPLQNDYGQGTNGSNVLSVPNDPNSGVLSSWGPRFGTAPTRANGLAYLDANGELQTQDYRAYRNNTRDFYRPGYILQNGVNIAGGNAEQNLALNVSNTRQEGITKFSGLTRTTVQLAGNTRLLNKLEAGGSVNFIQSNQAGPPQGNSGSPFGRLNVVPRSYNLQGLPYIDPVTRQSIFIPSAVENPYWSLERNSTTSNLTRFINVANLRYAVTPWLNVAYRAGLDTYTDRRKQIYDVGSIRAAAGQIIDQDIFRSEVNGDMLVTLKKDNLFREGLNANLLLGQNINQRRLQTVQSTASELIFPDFPSSSNGKTFNGSGELSTLQRLVGYYGQLSLAYNDYLFLELTGRADQSSTLPAKQNTFFYPSATLGFVFTDAFNFKNDYFSYGKIRANVARVGRDATPYSINTTYIATGVVGNNVASIVYPVTTAAGTTYAGFDLNDVAGGGQALTPEFTKSFEVGTNLGFFNNRLSLDLTYFKTINEQQIVPVSTAPTSGFVQRFANVGRMDNQGLEALVNITPIKTSSFRWDVAATFTRIRNEVKAISDGVTESAINGAAFTGTIASYISGLPYGVIRGNKKPTVTDEKSPYYGQYLINPSSGLFMPDVPNQVIADPNVDWQAGLTNTFSYKGLTASFLVDGSYGGDVISFTAGQYRSLGALKQTGADRELPRVIPGVIANGDGTYRPNNIQVDAQSYWSSFGLQSDLNVYDASVVRLREVSLGYALPKQWLARTPFGQASISLSGRNLFFYAPNAPFDPEVNTQGAGNIRGLELQGSPNARTYGVNLRFSL
ncbi:SusC/RagA family TonB-linked outer membrane protein [Hymenobacter jeollabukensis]